MNTRGILSKVKQSILAKTSSNEWKKYKVISRAGEATGKYSHFLMSTKMEDAASIGKKYSRVSSDAILDLIYTNIMLRLQTVHYIILEILI